MSERLTVWSTGMSKEGGIPGGTLHWGLGEDMLCGKSDGVYHTDFEDMQAALKAGRAAGHDIYGCGRCGELYKSG